MENQVELEEPKRTTTLVVNPKYEPKVLALKEEVEKLKAYIEGQELVSPEGVKAITNDLACVMTLNKTIDDERQKYTKPINTHLNFINAFFHTLTDPLDEALRHGKDKINNYSRDQERIRQEEELKARSAALAAAALATPVDQVDSSTGEVTTAAPLLPIVRAPEATPIKYQAALATSSQKMIAKCRVINFAALPDEYKMVNERVLNDVVKAGARAIPGVEIWLEPDIQIRRKQA